MQNVTYYFPYDITLIDEESNALAWKVQLNEWRAAGFDTTACELKSIEAEDRDDIIIEAVLPDEIAAHVKEQYSLVDED